MQMQAKPAISYSSLMACIMHAAAVMRAIILDVIYYASLHIKINFPSCLCFSPFLYVFCSSLVSKLYKEYSNDLIMFFSSFFLCHKQKTFNPFFLLHFFEDSEIIFIIIIITSFTLFSLLI